MKQVLDSNGVAIHGVFRGTNGSLIVDDNIQYKSALEQKKRAEAASSTVVSLLEAQSQQSKTINNLTKEISELKQIINQFISNSTINKNSTKGQ